MANLDKLSRRRTLSVDWNKVIKLDVFRPNIYRVLKNEVKKGRESITSEKPTEEYCTGSSYTGQWGEVGMCGFGTYIFPHSVEYEGQLFDGMFHGEGTLTYPMGHKLDGVWIKGKLVAWQLRFPDGLEYNSKWKYCVFPDRRFYICLEKHMNPAGREYLTNQQPTRTIPEGCYDAGDGFYNPKTKCVTSANYPKKVLRVPTASEEAWILENCRKAWDEPVGFKPSLYEYWMSGRNAELGRFSEAYSQSESTSDSSHSFEGNSSLVIFVTVPHGMQTDDSDLPHQMYNK